MIAKLIPGYGKSMLENDFNGWVEIPDPPPKVITKNDFKGGFNIQCVGMM